MANAMLILFGAVACGESTLIAIAPDVAGAQSLLLGEPLEGAGWRVHGIDLQSAAGWPVNARWPDDRPPVLAYYDRPLSAANLEAGVVAIDPDAGRALDDVFNRAPIALFGGQGGGRQRQWNPLSALPATLAEMPLKQPPLVCEELVLSPWTEFVPGKYKWSFIGSDGAAWVGTDDRQGIFRVTAEGVRPVDSGTVTVSYGFETEDSLLIGDYAGYVFETTLDPDTLATSYRRLGPKVDETGIYAVVRVGGTTWAISNSLRVYRFTSGGQWQFSRAFTSFAGGNLGFQAEVGTAHLDADGQVRLRSYGIGTIFAISASGVEEEPMATSSIITAIHYLGDAGWIAGTDLGALFQLRDGEWVERPFEWEGFSVNGFSRSAQGFYVFITSGVVVHVNDAGECPEPVAQLQVSSRGELLPLGEGQIVISKEPNLLETEIRYMNR